MLCVLWCAVRGEGFEALHARAGVLRCTCFACHAVLHAALQGVLSFLASLHRLC